MGDRETDRETETERERESAREKEVAGAISKALKAS